MENYSYPRSFKVRNKPPNRSLKNITETKKKREKITNTSFLVIFLEICLKTEFLYTINACH